MGGRGSGSSMGSVNITPDDWENWALDPEPFQQALNGESISNYLQGERLSADDKRRIRAVAQEMENRAETETVSNDTLFRGESFNSLEEAQRKYAVGNVITNDKLTSYTTDSDIATEYASSGGPIRVVITNTNVNNSFNGSVGVRTDPLGIGGSSEVLTARGMQSRVFSSSFDSSSNTLYVGMTNDARPRRR